MTRRNLSWVLLGVFAVTPAFAADDFAVLRSDSTVRRAPAPASSVRESGDASSLMGSRPNPSAQTITAAPVSGNARRVVVIPPPLKSGVTPVSSVRTAELALPAPASQADGATQRAEFKPIARMDGNGSVTPVQSAASPSPVQVGEASRGVVDMPAPQASAAPSGQATQVRHSSWSVGVGIGINTGPAYYYEPVYRPAYCPPTTYYYSPMPVMQYPTAYCAPAPVYYCPPAPRYYYAPGPCFPAYPRYYCGPSSGFSFSFRGRF